MIMKSGVFCKKCGVLCAAFFCFLLFPAAARGKNELAPPGSWVYDALASVALEEGRLDFCGRAPLSVGEIRFFLKEASYESLSAAGKMQYDRIESWCSYTPLEFGPDLLKLGLGLEMNAEGYYKQNDDLEWVFSRYDKKPLLYVPVKIEAADWFTMLFEARFAKNKNSMEENDGYTSIPLSADEIDINFPDTGYFSTSYAFSEETSLLFRLGSGASSFSRSLSGSIAQSEYFTGSSYAELGFYTPNFRYAMNVNQFNVGKYLYSHELSFRFFKKLLFSARESLLVYAPLELRYLNPWTIFHGFAAWRDYGHNESNTCDYLALKLEYAPVKCVRLYGEFAMTQFQTPYETGNFDDDTTPNGLAFQGGIESYIPFKDGYFHVWLEGTYTDPYMYIKESPDWSMVRNYRENLGDTKHVFYEWIGTPFGPDTAAGKLSFSYERPGRWSLGASYLLKACGEYSGTKVFRNMDWHEGKEFDTESEDALRDWAFPDSGSQGEQEAKRRQKLRTPSGTNEYVNVISLRGSFSPKETVTLVLQPSYTVAVNFNNEQGRTERGFEIAFAANIRFF